MLKSLLPVEEYYPIPWLLLATMPFNFWNSRMWMYASWVCSLHHEIGVSGIDYFECEMKRAMVNCSDKIVALTGRIKSAIAESFKICAIDMLDFIVTEIDPENEIFDPTGKEIFRFFNFFLLVYLA